LENKRIPDSWKGALIHRIPKKDNIPDDPSTWRDISLLPTIYKVFFRGWWRLISYSPNRRPTSIGKV